MPRLSLIACLTAVSFLGASADTYVITPDGSGDFPLIQAAIDAAEGGDIIELTDGTFAGDGNRDIDYLGKAITVRSQSGNPEACVIDCEGTYVDPHHGFYFGTAEGAESILEGVTVTNASDSGIRCTGASPLISHCIFLGNWAEYGGGISCGSASPTFTNCNFDGNSAAYGAGMYCGNSSPTLIDCTFSDNSATEVGGGMGCNSYASPALVGCTFSDNDAAQLGGGMYCEMYSSPQVEYCTFSGNAAAYGGGGIACAYGSSVTVTSCTLVHNAASSGGGLQVRSASSIVMENAIIAFSTNGEAIHCADDTHAALTCCDLYGNAGDDWVGCIADQLGVDGNISEDPQFCSPSPDSDMNWTLQSDSPCAPFSAPNEECNLIGAWPVVCGDTPAQKTTWGGIKAAFR